MCFFVVIAWLVEILDPTIDTYFTVWMLVFLVRTEWDPFQKVFVGRDFSQWDDDLSENIIFVFDIDFKW